MNNWHWLVGSVPVNRDVKKSVSISPTRSQRERESQAKTHAKHVPEKSKAYGYRDSRNDRGEMAGGGTSARIIATRQRASTIYIETEAQIVFSTAIQLPHRYKSIDNERKWWDLFSQRWPLPTTVASSTGGIIYRCRHCVHARHEM